MTHKDSVLAIVGSYPALLNDLDNRSKKDDAAKGMYGLFTKKEYIVTLLALCDILPVKASFFTAVQAITIDLSDLKLLLHNVEVMLENMITTLQDVFDDHIDLPSNFVMPMLSKVNVFIDEIESHGRHNVKNKANSGGRTWKWMIDQVKKFIRALITNQAARFPHVEILDALAILFTPRNFLKKTDAKFATFGNEALETCINHFQKLDADGSGQYVIDDRVAVIREWSTFKEAVADRQDKGDVDLASLKSLAVMFGVSEDAVQRKFLWPKLFMLWNYVMIQLISSAEPERLFSLMKMIETARRSGLENEMLTCLMRIADYGPSPTEFTQGPLIEKVIDLWYASSERLADLGAPQKKVTANVPAAILASISTGKRTVEKQMAEDSQQPTTVVWSFSGGKYNASEEHTLGSSSIKLSAADSIIVSRKRKNLNDGHSLYTQRSVIESEALKQPRSAITETTTSVTQITVSLKDKNLFEEEDEDNSALEVVRVAQKETESRRFKRSGDDTFSASSGASDDEENVGEAELAPVPEKHLSTKQISELKRLRTDAVLKPAAFFEANDPYADNASRNRTLRYKPSAKSLENLYK